MIGVIASIVAFYAAGSYVGILSAVPWLISLKNRDAGLIAFLLYVLYASNSVSFQTVYSYASLVRGSAVALATLILLDDVLRVRHLPDRRELASLPFLLLGVLFPESVIVGSLLALAIRLSPNVFVPAVLLGLAAVFALFRQSLDYAGSAPTQVAVMSAFGIFITFLLFVWKTFKKRELFNS
ncbi:hypothetical protein [Thermococcus prieurii]